MKSCRGAHGSRYLRRSEIQRIWVAYPIRPEHKSPKSGVDDYLASRIPKRAEEFSGHRVKSVNDAVTKIADQDVVTEDSEISARLCYSPRRIEWSIAGKASNESTFLVENVHDTIALWGWFQMHPVTRR